MARLCGPDCLFPDEFHREPEPDWLGDFPVMHGESEHEVPGSGHDAEGWGGYRYRCCRTYYCLCGHPDYASCPAWWDGGGLAGLVIERGPNWTPEVGT
jgi:hypothetical protein